MSEGTAAEILDLALARPELLVHPGDLPATAEALRDLFAASGRFFDRGTPVRIIRSADDRSPAANPLTRHNVVMEAHRRCRPMKLKSDGSRVEVTLYDRVAQMYLDMAGEWRLLPLNGVTTAPILSATGAMRISEGYDQEKGLWCSCAAAIKVPDRPSRAEAEAAVRCLRQTFRTFPFADAARCWDASIGAEVVDLTVPPGKDESSFLVALLTAVCRASLWLAPGFLVMAPAVSGAGTGKGLLVRAINMIAFGIRPRAFTMGGDRQELDKRLAAELIEARPSLFLDNANGIALRSDLLASILTERPSRIRLLGQTRMVELNSTAFIAATGNGLTMSEDLVRRFIASELNANCEDPELRSLPGGFLDQIEVRRGELLSSLVTIWRFGRQNGATLRRGKPLGSFETWSDWCRDPFLTLDCRDPIERMEILKASDPRRQRIAELFRIWWEHHKSDSVKAIQLAEPVRGHIDPQGRGRQYVATYLSRLAGTHAAGFVLNRQEPAGKWAAATYVLTTAAVPDATRHRTDRGHGPHQPSTTSGAGLIEPMSPMPHAHQGDAVPPGAEAAI